MDTLLLAIPWAVFLVLILLGFPFYLCYCCDCCPCCDSCRKQGYYKGMELRWPAACALASMGLLLGAAIYGITTQNDLANSINRLRCAGVYAIDEFIVGSTSDQFIGLNPFAGKLQTMQTELNGFFNSIDSTFGPQDWITQDPNTFSANVNTTGNINVVYTLNPIDGSTVNINSPFIANQFSGNNWQNNLTTYMGSIYGTLTPALDAVSQSLLDVNSQGLSLQNEGNSFISAVSDGTNDVNNIISQLANIRDTLNSDIKNNDSYVTVDFTDGFGGALYALIAISALTGLALIYMMLTGRRALRICLHCAWLLTLLYGIVFLILATTGIPVSVVTMEICEEARLALNIPGELNNFTSISSDMANRVATCKYQLGGNGDLLSTFNVKQKLDQVLDLRTKLQTAFASTNSSDPNSPLSQLIANGVLITQAYQAALSVLQMGKDTTARGKANAVDEDPNVLQAINNLNTYTLKSSRAGNSGCISSGANDQWVQDPTLCMSGYTKVTTKAPDSQTDSCIAVSVFDVGPTISVNDRYPAPTTSFPSCTNFPSIQSTYQNLFNSLYQRYSKLVVIVNDLNGNSDSISNTFNGYLTKVQNYQTNLNNFQSQALTILDQFDANNTNYILQDLGCLFFGENLDNLHASVCYLVLPAYYTISKLGIVIGLAAFVATFFLFCTAIRFYKNQQLEEINKEKNVDDRGRPLVNKEIKYQVPGVD